MKRFRLGRRTWLKGLGSAIALPALDAMFDDRGRIFRTAEAAPEPEPVRLITFFIPNGVPLHYPKGRADQYLWFPRETGTNWSMTRCLEPIAGYRDRFSILNGVVLGTSCADGHAGGTSGFATGLVPTKTGASGPSIDRVAAEKLGNTPFKSLGVGVKAVDTQFNDFNISTFDEISWSGKDQVEPLRRDPKALFETLFGNIVPGNSQQVERRKRYRLSVLDFVKQDAERLTQRLGQSDRLRLAAHFAALRDLELRIQAVSTVTCTKPAAPGSGLGYVDRAKLQAELLAMAFKCDLTRYGAYMYGHGGNDGGGKDVKYGLVEAAGEYPQQHNFTHALEDEAKYDSLFASITQFTLVQMGVFAHFLDKLQEGTAGPNDFLQNTLIYFGSELGNGVNHDNVGNVLPVLLVGNAGGKLKTGQHVKFTERVRSARVLLTALQLAGVDVQSFAGTSEALAL